MKAHASRRGLKLATWALMLTPLLLLLVFFTLAMHVRLGLGHWPEPMMENYRTAAYEVHGGIVIGIGLFAIWGVVPLWFVLVSIQRFQPAWSWKLPVVQAVSYAAGWGVVAAYAAWDPWSFLAWFLD